jgi:hypothetical protein
MTTRKMTVRLAFREEGYFWNCYLAKVDTLESGKLVGSIAIGPVKANPAVKRAFMEAMKMALSDMVEATTGNPPDSWHEEPAKEGDRKQ